MVTGVGNINSFHARELFVKKFYAISIQSHSVQLLFMKTWPEGTTGDDSKSDDSTGDDFEDDNAPQKLTYTRLLNVLKKRSTLYLLLVVLSLRGLAHLVHNLVN